MRRHRDHMSGGWMFKIFPFFFGLIFCAILAVWGISAYLGYQCYASNDPNSMACYMMSDRLELGIRER